LFLRESTFHTVHAKTCTLYKSSLKVSASFSNPIGAGKAALVIHWEYHGKCICDHCSQMFNAFVTSISC